MKLKKARNVIFGGSICGLDVSIGGLGFDVIEIWSH